jgi:hypothetical protein
MAELEFLLLRGRDWPEMGTTTVLVSFARCRDRFE